MDRPNRILVVDDDAATRRLLVAAFANESSIQVVTARGAVEALELLQSDSAFQLIVSDLNMPILSGIEFIRRFRIQNHTIPILVLSSIQTDHSVAKALELGADDYLQKPVDLRELRRAAASLISRRKQRSESPGDPQRARAGSSNSRASKVRVGADGAFVELTAPTDPMQAERFQRFAERLLSTSLTEKERHNLHLSLEEILRNAIEWGNKNDHTKKLRLSYCLLPDRITFRIEDEGKGFDHAALKDPSADPQAHIRERRASGKRMGGWGVFLTRKVMDNVSYNDKGNVVFLTKFLRRAETGSLEDFMPAAQAEAAPVPPAPAAIPDPPREDASGPRRRKTRSNTTSIVRKDVPEQEA